MSALWTRVVLAASLAAVLSPVFLAGQAEPEEERLRKALAEASGPGQRAESALALARLLADADEASPERLEEIHRLYAQALEGSTGDQWLEAHNSYGVFLLRQGEPERAAAVLLPAKDALEADPFNGMEMRVELWANPVDPATHSRLLYNYGVALERSGDVEKAVPAYLRSFELDPGFMPACEAVFRSSQDLPDRGAGLRVSVVERLLERGDLESARDYLRKSFSEGTSESYPELTELWARYLTAARIGPGQDHRLGAAQPDWLDGAMRARLALIERSYSGELPLLLYPAEGKRFTHPWQESEEAALAFSGLLQMVGDELMQQGRPREALPRYALAWSSAGNLEAAIRLVGLLRSAREEVDPQREVLDRVISVFFGGTEPTRLPASGPLALRFHTALALLLESDEEWGTASGPRSAVYQWERALVVQQGLATDGPAPGLHAHLATAYKEAGRTNEALVQFVAAGEQYLVLGRPEAAETQLLRAEELATGTGGDTQRLASLRTAIAESKATQSRPRTDGDITTDVQYRLAADPVFRGKVVDVSTIDGRVTVRATAGGDLLPSIEDIVRSSPGVTEITVKMVEPPR